MNTYTDLKQSIKLAAILPLESADMKWFVPADDEDAEEVSLIENKSEYALFDEVKPKLEGIIPELEANEDERIRGAIIDHLKDCNLTEWAAWLEKQGKEEYTLKSSKDEDVRKFMQYIEKEAKAYDFNLPNRGYDIYAFAKDILYWLEMQGDKRI